MKWGIVAVMMAIILIVVIVNATRIQRIRADLDGKSSDRVLPEVESLLIRGESGDRIPKKAYWVTVHPDPNPESDIEQLLVAHGDGSADTDGQAFDADVGNRRIRYIYSADQRAIFSIELTSGKYMLRPVSSSSLRLVPRGMSEPRKMTLVGLPESLVTATASSV